MHLEGSWGYCPSECPTACTPGSHWAPDTCNTCVCGLDGQAVCTQLPCSLPLPPPSSPTTKCLTEAGPDQGRACVLPFSFQGKVHSTCAPWTFGGEQEGKLWCSTRCSSLATTMPRTSPLGVHIDGGGHYGFCSTNCGPIEQTSSEARCTLKLISSTLSDWKVERRTTRTLSSKTPWSCWTIPTKGPVHPPKTEVARNPCQVCYLTLRQLISSIFIMDSGELDVMWSTV